jgi:protein-tyrosine phosphatase
MGSGLHLIEGGWPGRLGILPRPRGGDWLAGDVRAWRASGVGMVVSLLTPEEVADLGLGEEEGACAAEGIRFVAFPIEDRGVPSSTSGALDLIRRILRALNQGDVVGVHCRQGVGRSSIVAAGTLVLSGVDPERALSRVAEGRGVPVPETPEQRRWVLDLARLAAPPP